MRPVQWIPAGIAVACIALGGFAVMRTRPSQSAAGSGRSSLPPSGTAEPAVPDLSPPVATVMPRAAGAAVSELLAGQQAYVAGDVEGAIERLQAAVDGNPDDPRALNDLGQALVRAGHARDATQHLDRAMRRPDGLALEASRRPRDAAAAYMRYLELKPDAPEADKVKAHLADISHP